MRLPARTLPGTLALLALWGAAPPVPPPATVVVVGVADARTGAPIAGAEVVLPDLRRLVVTNWMGEARFPAVPAGEHRVRVRRLGYAPSEVAIRVAGDSVGPVFFLEPATPALDTVRVLARRGPPPVPPGAPEAFGWRRQMGIGRFLTSEELAPEGDRSFAMIAAGRFPGLRRELNEAGLEQLVTQRGACGAAREFAATSGPWTGGSSPMLSSCGGAACPVRVLIDGIDADPVAFSFVRTWDLAAVEFYSAANAPVQYRDGKSGCGVLLLWSKR